MHRKRRAYIKGKASNSRISPGQHLDDTVAGRHTVRVGVAIEGCQGQPLDVVSTDGRRVGTRDSKNLKGEDEYLHFEKLNNNVRYDAGSDPLQPPGRAGHKSEEQHLLSRPRYL